MGDDLIHIIIFAMIAAFLIYRLRAVLGRRHGEERRRPNPFTVHEGGRRPNGVGGPPQGAPAPTPVQGINLPHRNGGRDVGGPAPAPDEPLSLAQGLALVHAADPSFDEKRFVDGARAAFEMIVSAFARGDTEVLRPLLEDGVYRGFADAIAQRQAAGETMETRVLKFDDVDIVEARVDGRMVMVTVRFGTQQISAVRAADGSVLDGDPETPAEVTDVWTFARDTRSRDPDWLLVETRTPN